MLMVNGLSPELYAESKVGGQGACTGCCLGLLALVSWA